MFYEHSNHKVCIQRIETTTGNGVPDLLVFLPHGIFLIESKFETTRLRPEQAAFQIKGNSISKSSVSSCLTLSAYPKTKRLVVSTYALESIGEDGIKPVVTTTFTLDSEGFKQFYETFMTI